MIENWINAEMQCPCCGRDYSGDEDLAAGDRCPAIDCPGYGEDWYAKRDELTPGMVFRTYDGIVRLDHRVPGDGTDWRCDVWIEGRPEVPGYEQGHWSCEEARHHPGDFVFRLPDDYAGEQAT